MALVLGDSLISVAGLISIPVILRLHADGCVTSNCLKRGPDRCSVCSGQNTHMCIFTTGPVNSIYTHTHPHTHAHTLSGTWLPPWLGVCVCVPMKQPGVAAMLSHGEQELSSEPRLRPAFTQLTHRYSHYYLCKDFHTCITFLRPSPPFPPNRPLKS